MRPNLTDITVVMDRSGSMASSKSDAEGGLNHFVTEQKKLPGEALFTLVQFDTNYEFVHRAIPIAAVPACTLDPRGSTALLDAVARTILETGQRLAAMPERDRPGLVVFLIITDGQENASREFTLAKVKELIEHQQSAYKWQFSYLGANQDSFAEAGGLGIAGGTADFSMAQTQRAYFSASANVGRMRGSAAAGTSVINDYTEEERGAMKGS